MEHIFVDQITAGRLSRGGGGGAREREREGHWRFRVMQRPSENNGLKPYLAHGVARRQRIREEQVPVRPEDPVAVAAAA